MKNKLISLLAIIVCIAISVSLIGCSETDGEDGTPNGNYEAETFEPVTDRGEESDLYKRYAEYKENADLAFKSNSPASQDSFEYETSCEGVTIKKYVGEETILVVPEKIGGMAVTYIEAGAFSGKNLRALYIPDSVESIASGLLSGCDALVTLRLPMLGFGENNFLGYVFGASAPDQNAVKVPVSLDMLMFGDLLTEVADNAFMGCKTLSAVVLPNTVKSIGSGAFYECSDLVYLYLGERVEKIGEYAFAYCRALYSVDISMAEEIGDGVLFSCSAINNIKLTAREDDFLGRLFGAEKTEYNSDFVSASLRCVEIAEGSKAISDRMFSSCKYITEVILPKSLETVGIRAFYACRSLGAIKMASVKTVSDDAFFGCDNLVEAELGDSLDSLGMQAFFGCKALKSISLPDTLKELKSATFYGCSSLVTVELGGVRRIGKDAFSGCVKLTPVSTSGIEVAEGNGALKASAEE